MVESPCCNCNVHLCLVVGDLRGRLYHSLRGIGADIGYYLVMLDEDGWKHQFNVENTHSVFLFVITELVSMSCESPAGTLVVLDEIWVQNSV